MTTSEWHKKKQTLSLAYYVFSYGHGRIQHHQVSPGNICAFSFHNCGVWDQISQVWAVIAKSLSFCSWLKNTKLILLQATVKKLARILKLLLLNQRLLLTSGRFHDQHYKKNHQSHFLEIILTSSPNKKKNWIAPACSESLQTKTYSQFSTSVIKQVPLSMEHLSNITTACCWRRLSKWDLTYFYYNIFFHTSGNISRFFFANSFQIQKALQDFLLQFSYSIDVFCSVTRALQSQASRYLPQDRCSAFLIHKENKLCKTGPCRNIYWKLPFPSMRKAQCCRLDMLMANFEPVGKQWVMSFLSQFGLWGQ